ncbi:MAG: hypothetical protein EXQ97_08615 [Alphaproteobacteria bacterium]|nr:hypothetical protein [Alphaproteobacteria bacterium]
MTKFLTLTSAAALAAALALPAIAGEVAKKSEEAYGCSWGESPATAAAEQTPEDADRAKMIVTLDKWLEDLQSKRQDTAVASTPVAQPGS